MDQSFEPVARFENPSDELPRESRVELNEATQSPLVSDVPIAQASVTTIHAEAWQSVWIIVSPALSAWVAIAVLWLLVRSLWFRSRLRKARRMDRGRAVEILRELQPRARVRLLIVPGFSEPAAFGISRPTIVLPASCEALPREELRAVLAHELGHIVRGDVWWLLIGRVLTTVLGFQPLNRIARREWTAAAECLCDSWAVDRGVERLTLARCLTALAEHRLTGVSLADALAAVGSPSSLRTRIERLVAEPVVDPWAKQSRRWLLSGSVIAAAVLSAVMLPLPKTLTASVPRPSGSGLHEDHAEHEPFSDGRGSEMVREIETELTALRSELNRAEQQAEQQSDPQWLDAVEQLRDRERLLVERWRVLRNETGPAQEMGTLIDADLR
ncbi:MAG: M56 family metallopeptidase [Planctomycetaceae bacterium]